jgi:hypothetical protein
MTKLALVLVLAACGGGKDNNAAPKVDVTPDHLAAVNAAIPADLKGKVEFEIGTIVVERADKDTYKVARPKGWKPAFMPGELTPADADDFGSPTLGKSTMTVSSNCDGRCEKKDWAKVSDKADFAQFVGGKPDDGKVLKDVMGTNTRTVVYEHKVSENFPDKDVAISIVTAWWNPDGSRYFTCRAELGTPIKGLAVAFETACSKVSGE